MEYIQEIVTKKTQYKLAMKNISTNHQVDFQSLT